MGYADDDVEVISAVIIIAQSDIKYLMKVNLEQLHFEQCHGSMIETVFTTSMVRYFLRGSCFQVHLCFGKNKYF